MIILLQDETSFSLHIANNCKSHFGCHVIHLYTDKWLVCTKM
jgi:hypothetical protein